MFLNTKVTCKAKEHNVINHKKAITQEVLNK